MQKYDPNFLNYTESSIDLVEEGISAHYFACNVNLSIAKNSANSFSGQTQSPSQPCLYATPKKLAPLSKLEEKSPESSPDFRIIEEDDTKKKAAIVQPVLCKQTKAKIECSKLNSGQKTLGGQQSGLMKEKEGTVLRPHFELLKQGELKARCLIPEAQTEFASVKEGETALKREAV